jgi:hypothetical protein
MTAQRFRSGPARFTLAGKVLGEIGDSRALEYARAANRLQGTETSEPFPKADCLWRDAADSRGIIG